jgi:hypothetical protein
MVEISRRVVLRGRTRLEETLEKLSRSNFNWAE